MAEQAGSSRYIRGEQIDMSDPDNWWKQAVIYQIYPRSFSDSTGSGIGDLRGIAERMGYLGSLGVDAIWLSPFYPSQLADGGYDVDDYRDVDPRLGTVADFDDMAQAAHRHGIKVIVDIVPNHSSNRHPWFVEALQSPPGSEQRDRYIFRDGRGDHGQLPPTGWQSHFGGSAWTRVPDGQWYLHLFTEQQPDWNWNNPDVHEDFIKTIRFWSSHGADGFRIDVAHGLAKDLDRDDLDDYPVLMQLPADGSHPLFDRNEVHDIYREWRTVFNEYTPHRFAVAEAWVNPDRQYLYASEDELGQIFNFEFAKADWSRNQFHTAIEEGLAASRRAHSPATWVLSNHDIPRHATRFALPQVPSANYHQFAADWILRGGKTYAENREAGTQRSRAAIMMEMALPGSAYIYQGEELGLFEVPDIPWDRLEDPVAFNTRHSELNKGRDGCRVPLPWNADRLPGSKDPFGFSPAHSAAAPHLPQPAWFKDFAVDREEHDSTSMLNFYRRVLRLRHKLQCPDTSLEWLDEDMPSGQPDGAGGLEGGVIAYRRANGWASVTNFSSSPVKLPPGDIILTSSRLEDDGSLPQDTTAWVMLKQ